MNPANEEVAFPGQGSRCVRQSREGLSALALSVGLAFASWSQTVFPVASVLFDVGVERVLSLSWCA